MPTFFQLYNIDGTWVGQFPNALAIEKYLSDKKLDPKKYEIRVEPSKYPS
jgi:hypothetical protein